MQIPAAKDCHPLKNNKYMKIAVRTPDIRAPVSWFFIACFDKGFIYTFENIKFAKLIYSPKTYTNRSLSILIRIKVLLNIIYSG